MGREGETAYLNQPLDPDGWATRQLGLVPFSREGCPWMGTLTCLECELDVAIPLEDCDPPDECVTCEARERCPCGSAAYRMELLKGDGAAGPAVPGLQAT